LWLVNESAGKDERNSRPEAPAGSFDVRTVSALVHHPFVGLHGPPVGHEERCAEG